MADDGPPPPAAIVGEVRPYAVAVVVEDHDPAWPGLFEQERLAIRAALGPAALTVEHVGSTSVPGLPAKPILDLDLVVDDPEDEPAYVPALESAGLVLVVREPWWYAHRLLRGTDPAVNLHVFGPGSPESARQRLFRDRLRTHPEERDRYAAAKRAAAEAAVAAGEHVQQYNARKQQALREIYAALFADAGLSDS